MMIHLSKYAVVGLLGTALHFALLALAVELGDVDPVFASLAVFPPVVLLSYVLNRNWTFRSEKDHYVALPKYLVISLASLATNFFVMNTLVNVYGMWYIAAQVCSIGIIPIVNFLLKKYWAFV